MEKSRAVASLGHRGLLLPVWVKAALAANDRLKLYLSLLQAASNHADHPEREALDLVREMTAAGLDARWLRDLPGTANRVDGMLLVPELARLAQKVAEDLVVMARPVLESTKAGSEPHVRVQHWLQWLGALRGDQLARGQLHALTHGKRGEDDSLHLLVMDLHKKINGLAGELASAVIDGAHVWQLLPADELRVAAFMRGLNRTAPLKLDHPGLDTAATRDGDRLLLQNDIGTNDVHVLVIQVEGRTITLTYSDLRRARFEFFQAMLSPAGAQWGVLESRTSAGLNEGAAYSVGTARFECADDKALDATLEAIGSRIVFLIDWNRARKRLLPFLRKGDAIWVLAEAARLEVGHMAWLRSGGDKLIFGAMQAVGEGAFHVGDRLDEVLGAADARAFLLEVLRLSSQAARDGQPVAMVADETRMLLARQVRQRTSEFDLLAEHAAYCHELAQAVSDGLSHGHDRSRDASRALAARAKAWERRADHLVMQARDRAERQPRWRPFARLLERSDDVADALEEAAFLMDLVADHHHKGWNDEVRKVLSRLAGTVLRATQDHVKALEIARTLGAGSEAADTDAFLAASWSVLRAERQSDELLRSARRVILEVVHDAPSLMLANDLAAALELASDRLLAAGYGLREVAFNKAGTQA